MILLEITCIWVAGIAFTLGFIVTRQDDLGNRGSGSAWLDFWISCIWPLFWVGAIGAQIGRWINFLEHGK